MRRLVTGDVHHYQGSDKHTIGDIAGTFFAQLPDVLHPGIGPAYMLVAGSIKSLCCSVCSIATMHNGSQNTSGNEPVASTRAHRLQSFGARAIDLDGYVTQTGKSDKIAMSEF